MDAVDAVRMLLSPRPVTDPHVAYAALRAHGPVLDLDGTYFVSGYAAIDAVLRDPAVHAYDSAQLDRRWSDWRSNRAVELFADSMLRRNPPDHTRMRRLASGVFTARRVAGLRELIENQVGVLLAELAQEPEPDFVAHLAYPLPIAVICALLGVPPADRGQFRRLAEALTAVLEVRFDEQQARVAHQAAGELEAYFRHLIERRRAQPRDDLVTALDAAHRQDGERLSVQELMANLALLLVAGFETTTNLLGNGLVLLLEHPGHARRLAAEPERAPAYVEEILRIDSPVQLTERYAGPAFELAGCPVAAGAEMILLLGAANRDPDRFAEPDRFDPDRPQNAPLSFGAGAHYCLGAPLARLEAQIALPAVLRRFPGLRLAGGRERRQRLTLRGWATLPLDPGSVDWEAPSATVPSGGQAAEPRRRTTE
ncbi:cytochrome P450 [Mangrovihabitans endophyticus]|nr:cytochrome P450 [Mangrovihabitans endophyticus]